MKISLQKNDQMTWKPLKKKDEKEIKKVYGLIKRQVRLMPIEIIASDNKEFKRGRAGNTFRACIGTTISFENPDRFESRYKNFLRN